MKIIPVNVAANFSVLDTIKVKSSAVNFFSNVVPYALAFNGAYYLGFINLTLYSIELLSLANGIFDRVICLSRKENTYSLRNTAFRCGLVAIILLSINYFNPVIFNLYQMDKILGMRIGCDGAMLLLDQVCKRKIPTQEIVSKWTTETVQASSDETIKHLCKWEWTTLIETCSEDVLAALVNRFYAINLELPHFSLFDPSKEKPTCFHLKEESSLYKQSGGVAEDSKSIKVSFKHLIALSHEELMKIVCKMPEIKVTPPDAKDLPNLKCAQIGWLYLSLLKNAENCDLNFEGRDLAFKALFYSQFKSAFREGDTLPAFPFIIHVDDVEAVDAIMVPSLREYYEDHPFNFMCYLDRNKKDQLNKKFQKSGLKELQSNFSFNENANFNFLEKDPSMPKYFREYFKNHPEERKRLTQKQIDTLVRFKAIEAQWNPIKILLGW